MIFPCDLLRRPLNDPRASAIAIGAGLHAADAAAGAVAGGAI